MNFVQFFECIFQNDNAAIGHIPILLFIAFLCAVFPLFILCIHILRTHLAPEKHRLSTTTLLFTVSFFWILSVTLLRFCVYGYVNNEVPPLELSITSLLLAFRTVALDEDYFVLSGYAVNMIRELFPNMPFAVVAFGLFQSIMNLLAPVAGGAVLFNVLTKFFPKVKILFSAHRKQYYFSELNERSLALANSIARNRRDSVIAPLLIFTDTYVDEDSERSNELYIAAKHLGAVCINDDISHIHNIGFRHKTIFLMDDNEIDNIHTLAAFADDAKLSRLKKTAVYVFYQDDAYAMTEKNIIKDIEERIQTKYNKKIDKRTFSLLKKKCKSMQEKLSYKQLKKKCEKDKEYQSMLDECKNDALGIYCPHITRVRYYENTIFSLLRETPLFTPLLNPHPESRNRAVKYANGFPQLNVAIIGAGNIGKQMLVSSSWCGQFYGHSLGLNMISVEDKNDFLRVLQKNYPEFLKSTDANDPMLRIYDPPHGITGSTNSMLDETAPAYFTFRYAQADITSTSMSDIVCRSHNNENDTLNLLDADYYLVALGSDESNIDVAEELKRDIYRNQEKTGIKKNVIIVMIVFDKRINDLFNETTPSDDSEIAKHIRIIPYGSLASIYNYDTLTAPEQIIIDLHENLNYEKIRNILKNGCEESYNAETKNKEKSRAKKEPHHRHYKDRKKEIYNQWSNIARDIHLKYRIYSAYCFIQDNYFGTDEAKKTWKKLDRFDEYAIACYIRYVLESKTCDASLVSYLSWLEKRRWNAYLRSIGFTISKEKQISMKCHPLLVEINHKPYCRIEEGITPPCASCKFKACCTYIDKDAPRIVSNPENCNITVKDRLDVAGEYKKYDHPLEADKALFDRVKEQQS